MFDSVSPLSLSLSPSPSLQIINYSNNNNNGRAVLDMIQYRFGPAFKQDNKQSPHSLSQSPPCLPSAMAQQSRRDDNLGVVSVGQLHMNTMNLASPPDLLLLPTCMHVQTCTSPSWYSAPGSLPIPPARFICVFRILYSVFDIRTEHYRPRNPNTSYICLGAWLGRGVGAEEGLMCVR